MDALLHHVQADPERRPFHARDDEDRENEGDLICAAEKATPEAIRKAPDRKLSTKSRPVCCI
ncbi:bifunctional 3,4-dihydroxy-2-butanone-4-phosphate synthase/GTP cyclohydrolase II, partial [Lacticaseibacillus rhamnosus]